VLDVTAAIATLGAAAGSRQPPEAHGNDNTLGEAAATSSLRVHQSVRRRARFSRPPPAEGPATPYGFAILSSASTGFIDPRPREVGLS
jgi:hypothetical protein